MPTIIIQRPAGNITVPNWVSDRESFLRWTEDGAFPEARYAVENGPGVMALVLTGLMFAGDDPGSCHRQRSNDYKWNGRQEKGLKSGQ